MAKARRERAFLVAADAVSSLAARARCALPGVFARLLGGLLIACIACNTPIAPLEDAPIRLENPHVGRNTRLRDLGARSDLARAQALGGLDHALHRLHFLLPIPAGATPRLLAPSGLGLGRAGRRRR